MLYRKIEKLNGYRKDLFYERIDRTVKFTPSDTGLHPEIQIEFPRRTRKHGDICAL
jgi:hypothetical protein